MEPAYSSPPPVFSKRFQSFARWVVVIVLWLIIGSIAIGKAGIANFMGLLKERTVLEQTIMAVRIQNQQLENRIELLKTSPAEQTRYLKQSFGYVERDEYVFQFPKSQGSSAVLSTPTPVPARQPLR